MAAQSDPATVKAMVWTCRLALAVASQDTETIESVMAEVNSEPNGGPLLLTTMAGTIAAMMAEKAGANWRQAMEQSIVAVRGH